MDGANGFARRSTHPDYAVGYADGASALAEWPSGCRDCGGASPLPEHGDLCRHCCAIRYL
jgi:hypothetical protein